MGGEAASAHTRTHRAASMRASGWTTSGMFGVCGGRRRIPTAAQGVGTMTWPDGHTWSGVWERDKQTYAPLPGAVPAS